MWEVVAIQAVTLGVVVLCVLWLKRRLLKLLGEALECVRTQSYGAGLSDGWEMHNRWSDVNRYAERQGRVDEN